MRYTLWSRGRLLGETDLGFVYRENGFRCGWLHPTVTGERLMPAATGVAPALRAQWMIGPDPTARADVAAAVDHEESLELQLRGPSGAVIATESVGIIDTQYLLSIADSDEGEETPLGEEQEADIEALLAEWTIDCDPSSLAVVPEAEAQFPRYQIQVRLIDAGSLP